MIDGPCRLGALSYFTKSMFKIASIIFALAVLFGLFPWAASCANVKLTENCPYGTNVLQRLDIYSSTSAVKARRPVVIYVHGGGFVSGDKVSSVGNMPQFFNDSGYVFVSIDYRLSPKYRYPAHVQDLARSIAWVKAHISAYGGDGHKIFLLGHSAGAQLAAMVTSDQQFLSKEGLSPKAVSGVVLLDGGAYDVAASLLSKNRGPVNSQAFSNNPAAWRQASPIFQIRSGKNIPPYLIFYIAGTRQGAEQSIRLSRLLERASVPVILQRINHKNHRSLNDDLGRPGDTQGPVVIDFLRAHQ